MCIQTIYHDAVKSAQSNAFYAVLAFAYLCSSASFEYAVVCLRPKESALLSPASLQFKTLY